MAGAGCSHRMTRFPQAGPDKKLRSFIWTRAVHERDPPAFISPSAHCPTTRYHPPPLTSRYVSRRTHEWTRERQTLSATWQECKRNVTVAFPSVLPVLFYEDSVLSGAHVNDTLGGGGGRGEAKSVTPPNVRWLDGGVSGHNSPLLVFVTRFPSSTPIWLLSSISITLPTARRDSSHHGPPSIPASKGGEGRGAEGGKGTALARITLRPSSTPGPLDLQRLPSPVTDYYVPNSTPMSAVSARASIWKKQSTVLTSMPSCLTTYIHTTRCAQAQFRAQLVADSAWHGAFHLSTMSPRTLD
ncbi:hypothetical protein SODALDRAFT_362781 [Sodiomyces alkalinus F11]|uniref:Uncharacterized protein n=1 Tax=Sodiomyces alkalinus (strain CBS 110278 / VKM F-3762 / F11) TaxID=1314773 RepID=A0A3N2PN25_SODAK|nr:hypothetical protein SODALDRAFT_362781 [Sodiomyces alkalinus F11]ROT35925.1 hypothetical protein SODALDRAFT_362781 [Sodiomyces alkalinus F11]